MPLEKRSLSLNGHRTSVALEPDFWAALEDMAGREGISLSALVARLDTERLSAGTALGAPGLASALRVHALRYWQTHGTPGV